MKRGPKTGLVARERGEPVAVARAVLKAAGLRLGTSGAEEGHTVWLDPAAKRRWKKPRRIEVDPALFIHKRKPPFVNRDGRLCDADGILLAPGIYWIPPRAADGEKVLDRVGRRT